jgi:hypothetical protein
MVTQSDGPDLHPAVKDVVFAHLPKTAGTSLRNSLVEALPDAVKIFDYGPDTHLIEGDYINAFTRHANTPDGILALRQTFRREQRLLFAGHLWGARFLRSFHPASVVTFLRSPVERLVSAYKYHVSVLNYRGSFTEFYQTPGHINVQSRMLWGIDLRDIGFIGLTEAMPEMLPALSRHLGVELANRKDNLGYGYSEPEIDERTRAHVLALNDADVRLYRHVETNLDYYTNYRDRPRPLLARGKVHSRGDGVFRGWAAAFHTGGLVEIEVRLGDRVVHRCYADQFLPGMRERALAPHGVGGFSVRLPAELLAGERQVRFVIAGTETELDGSPIEL